MAEAVVLRSVKGSPLSHSEMDNNFINPFRNLIDGLITSNDSDADHDISVSVGVFTDSTNARTFETTSALVKQIDVNWAEGTAAGGFPTGLTLSADTWYHFFMIAKTDGTVDAGWDTSLTATNLLSDATGYTLFRRVASHLTDGSSNILGFSQDRDDFDFDLLESDRSSSTGVTTAVTQTLTTPLGIVTSAHLSTHIASSGSATVLVSPLTSTDEVPGAGKLQLITSASGQRSSNMFFVKTNTSSQVRIRTDATGVVINISTRGYIDLRGKE